MSEPPAEPNPYAAPSPPPSWPAYPPPGSGPTFPAPSVYSPVPGNPYATQPPPSGPSIGLAVAALVCAIIGLWPVGIVLAIVALTTRRPGRWLAISALVVSCLWVAGLYAFFTSQTWTDVKSGINRALSEGPPIPSPDPIFSDEPLAPEQSDIIDRIYAADATRDAGGTIDHEGYLSTRDLRLGDCYLLPPDLELDGLLGVPCSTPHAFEVYGVERLPGTDFPGEDEADVLAETRCEARFKAFIGRAHDDSRLDLYYFPPSAQSWATADRTIICSVRDPGPLTTGTLKGANL